MDLCTRHCCLKGDCDLAFMIRDSCYLVKCGNEMLCKTKKARPSNMNPRISFVTRLEPIKFQPRELLCFLNEVFALHASTAYQCKYFCSRTCLSKDIRIRIRFTSWRTLSYINVKIALKNCNCSALQVIEELVIKSLFDVLLISQDNLYVEKSVLRTPTNASVKL